MTLANAQVSSAIIGHISWDRQANTATQPSATTHHSYEFSGGSVSFNKSILGGGQSCDFVSDQLVVACFGRVCHWPDVSTDVLKARNQAELFAENYAPDLPFLAQLAGDFAVIIWDATTKTLMLVRDHLGTRPLFYVQTSNGVFFATNIESLLPHCENPTDLFAPKVEGFINGFQDEYPDRTMVSEIYQVPPATVVRFACGERKTEVYWRLSDAPKLRLGSDQDYYDLGRRLVMAAIRERIPAESPFGLHISGGLDSSTIAAVAVEHCKEQELPLPVGISWQPVVAPDATPTYDQEFVEYCAKTLGIEVRNRGVDQADFDEFISVDPATSNVTLDLMMELAAQRTVADKDIPLFLSGWGGDQGISCAGRSWKRAVAPNWVNHLWSMVRYRRIPAHLSYSKVTTGLMRKAIKMQQATHSQNVRDSQISMLGNGNVQNRMTCWSMHFPAQNVQYAFPLLDRRVVEFALGVPARLYKRPEMKRNLMRQIIKGMVPERVRLRPDKDEPARFANSKDVMHVIATDMCARLDGLEQETPRMAFLNMGKVRADVSQVAKTGGIVSGKLLRSLSFVLNGSR